jgi:uncharacterized protein YtpQ (UPF0354 family)
MSFLKKLFGKKSQQTKTSDSIAYNPNLEQQGYINVGKSVLPLLRNKNDAKFKMNMPKGSELCTKPIAGDLIAVYALDAGKDYQFINQKMLAKFGLPLEELERAGTRNLLEKTSGNLKIQTIETKDESNPDGNPFFRVILDGELDTSLLITEDFLGKMKEIVKEETVAFAAPRKDVLLVSPFTDKMTFYQMALTTGSLYRTAKEENNPAALSDYILVRKDGTWNAYENDKVYESHS